MEISISECGSRSDRGNLLGIQPEMCSRDYANVQSFVSKMSTYLDVAQSRGWLGPKTVVLFPEYIGIWLLAAGEPSGLFKTSTLDAAMMWIAIRSPWTFGREVLRARGRQRLKIAMFKAKSKALARNYHAAFSALSQKYSVTLVAGSIVLPGAKVRRGKIEVNNFSPLNNVSFIYRPDGNPEPRIIKKTCLSKEEVGLIAGGRQQDLPVFDTPAGKLAVLICADSWYPKSYGVIDKKGAELIAVPAFLPGRDVFHAPWLGYEVSTPEGVDSGQVGQISEKEAWVQFALPDRIRRTSIKNGLTVFLRGTFWDLESTGESIVVENQRYLKDARPQSAAAVVNLWLS